MDSIHCIRFAIDLFVLCLLGLTYAILKYAITPFYSGFYCDDYSVNLPYKPSTVNNQHLAAMATILPFFLISFTEIARTIYMRLKGTELSLHNRYKIRKFSGRIIEWPEQVGNIVVNYGTYLFGLLCTLILTLIGKQTIGRLR